MEPGYCALAGGPLAVGPVVGHVRLCGGIAPLGPCAEGNRCISGTAAVLRPTSDERGRGQPPGQIRPVQPRAGQCGTAAAEVHAGRPGVAGRGLSDPSLQRVQTQAVHFDGGAQLGLEARRKGGIAHATRRRRRLATPYRRASPAAANARRHSAWLSCSATRSSSRSSRRPSGKPC